MTLILTHISRHGIVHASDSNITAGSTDAGEGQKTFKVEHLNAGLTIAGSYSVGGIRMDDWMNAFIQAQTGTGQSSLREFAHNLRNELEAQMLPEQKCSGSMVHIAGYVEEGGMCHPEFWFVNNVEGINDQTGEYTGILDHFKKPSEDFWMRDCPDHKLMEAFQAGAYQIYVNGVTPGRIGFNFSQHFLKGFFYGLWNAPTLKFRPPRSIQETKKRVELDVRIIGTLFELSDYRARYIGGEPQTYVIPQPSNTVTESPPKK